MIRPEDVKVERATDHPRLGGGNVLRASINRGWGAFAAYHEGPLNMSTEELLRYQEERLRAGVMRDIYGGIADPLRIVDMALRILMPSRPVSYGFLAPEPLEQALAQLQAYADAGNYTPPASTAAPRLPQDMETDAE